jgi:hypothetical protein
VKPIRDIVGILNGMPKTTIYEVTEETLVFKMGHLAVVLSTGLGWDHVSVSCRDRVPRYSEMKAVKLLCFKVDEWAYELHAPPRKHINVHPNVLHLWRPHEGHIPIPPPELV